MPTFHGGGFASIKPGERKSLDARPPSPRVLVFDSDGAVDLVSVEAITPRRGGEDQRSRPVPLAKQHAPWSKRKPTWGLMDFAYESAVEVLRVTFHNSSTETLIVSLGFIGV